MMDLFRSIASIFYSLVLVFYVLGGFVFFVGLSMWFDNPVMDENLPAVIVILVGVLVMMMADDS